MDKEFDYIVKDTLFDETSEFTNTEDIFYRIEDKIKKEEKEKNKRFKQINFGYGFKKQFLVAVSILIVFSTLIFASSNQTRAFASQAIESIKTIFTLERSGNELKIVEKPINESKFYYGANRTTTESDIELSKKLGFSFKFPKNLCDSFVLEDKCLGIVLNKQTDPETYSNLEDTMLKAIEDDNAFAQLKPYDPVFTVSGGYKRSDKSTFFINIYQACTMHELENELKKIENLKGFAVKRVKIGELNGYFVKILYPEYPHGIKNGKYEQDMSVKPVMKEGYGLYWEKSSTIYKLIAIADYKLSLDESKKIAEEFMKVN